MNYALPLGKKLPINWAAVKGLTVNNIFLISANIVGLVALVFAIDYLFSQPSYSRTEIELPPLNDWKEPQPFFVPSGSDDVGAAPVDAIAEQKRPASQQRMDALAMSVAGSRIGLVIRSNVYEDSVFINDRHYGSTPVDVDLRAGHYRVSVKKAGYQTWQQELDLKAGEPIKIKANLQRIENVRFEHGRWRDGIGTGYGQYDGEDGSQYRGAFKNKQFDGFGELKKNDGTHYRGQWHLGLMHGKGTLSKYNGDKYIGQFRNGLFEGQGTYTKMNGDIYEGYWVEGKLNGRGRFSGRNKTVYTGEFVNGQYHGQGVLTQANGVRYQGEFVRGRYQGSGKLTLANNKYYKGEFYNGLYHGKGVLVNANGSSITSTFKLGKPTGFVTLKTVKGEMFRADSDHPGVCYRIGGQKKVKCPAMSDW